MTKPQLEEHCERLTNLLTQAEYILKHSLALLDPMKRDHRRHGALIKEWVVQWRGARLVHGVPLVETSQVLEAEE